MKQRGVFLIGVIVMGIYFFLFPHHSGKELVLLPASYTRLTPAATVDSSAGEAVFAVRNQDAAGFFDGEFRLAHLYSSRSMAVDNKWIAVSDEEGLAILDPDGRLRGRVQGESVPLARNGQLYLYSGDIGRLSMVDPSNGRLVWSRDFLSPLTVLDGAAGRTLAGLLDGSVVVIESGGELMLRYQPGGSRIEALYGGALSADGTKLALISGLDPQRFILLEERKNGFRPVSHHDTGTDFRRSVPIGFIGKGERILYEGIDSVVSVNADTYEVQFLELDGHPVDWYDDSDTRSLALLGGDRQSSSLRILSRQDLIFLESSLPEGSSGVIMENGKLLLIGEDHLGVMEMVVR